MNHFLFFCFFFFVCLFDSIVIGFFFSYCFCLDVCCTFLRILFQLYLFICSLWPRCACIAYFWCALCKREIHFIAEYHVLHWKCARCTAHKISRFAILLYVQCILAQNAQTIFLSGFVCACASLFFRSVSLVHLRFAYFKAIIVSYWTFQSLFSFRFVCFILCCVPVSYSSHSQVNVPFFSLKQRKAKTIKEKHKLSEQQTHTRIFACASVSLCCTVPVPVCVHAFALSFTPFTLSPLFLRFFLSLKTSKWNNFNYCLR